MTSPYSVLRSGALALLLGLEGGLSVAPSLRVLSMAEGQQCLPRVMLQEARSLAWLSERELQEASSPGMLLATWVCVCGTCRAGWR